MNRIFLVFLAFQVFCVVAVEVDNKEIDNNDVHATPASLDTNLRSALLKALNDLENEEPQKPEYFDKDFNRIVEKASASAVSILTRNDDEVVSSTPSSNNATSTVSTTEKPFVLLQKSEGGHKLTISTFEKYNESDQFVSSASSSFVQSKQDIPKSILNSKSQSSSINSIDTENKISTRSILETTTTAITPSTEESEAKVENVQFFSAPLVAAFTVHQNELGVSNKVEPIFKAAVNSQFPAPVKTLDKPKNVDLQKSKELVGGQQQFGLQQNQKLLQEEVSKLNYNLKQHQLALQQQEQLNNQLRNYNSLVKSQEIVNLDNRAKIQEQLRQQHQLAVQQKQKALEEEIYRLNLKLKQQQQLSLQQQINFQQQKQQQNFRLQQEQLRLAGRQSLSVSQQNPLNLGQSVFSTVQQLPNKEAQAFGSTGRLQQSTSILHPSVSLKSLIEAGKLPLNGQFLPVKGPVNFHSSPIGQPTFQQFTTPSQSFSNIVQPNVVFQQSPSLVPNNIQSGRILRQEEGVGNFVNQALTPPSSSFSIQKSVQPTQFTESTLVRNNIGPVLSNHLEPFRNQPKHNQFISSSNPPISPQFSNSGNSRNRFFRSNLESTLTAPGNFYTPFQNNRQFNNFIPNSEGWRGRLFF